MFAELAPLRPFLTKDFEKEESLLTWMIDKSSYKLHPIGCSILLTLEAQSIAYPVFQDLICLSGIVLSVHLLYSKIGFPNNSVLQLSTLYLSRYVLRFSLVLHGE